MLTTSANRSIEAIYVKCIKEPEKNQIKASRNKVIEERKILGVASSREQLHRKTYLMEDKQTTDFTNQRTCISILTPTSGERFRFLQLTWKWINQQNYPKDLIEWIILTDTSEEADILKKESKRLGKDLDMSLKIAATENKECIGMKRNICNRMADGDILINFDDDDYYFPNRISHAVDMLTRKENKTYELAGSHKLPIYFSDDKSLWMSQPGPNLACAGSFAYKKSLLGKTWYSANARRGEEISFTDDYRLPILELDPFSTMVCISHANNTFDKNKLRKKFSNGGRNYTAIDGKQHKGSSVFYCLSDTNSNSGSSEWEYAYEKITNVSKYGTTGDQEIAIFKTEREEEQGIAGFAMKLHKKFIGE